MTCKHCGLAISVDSIYGKCVCCKVKGCDCRFVLSPVKTCEDCRSFVRKSAETGECNQHRFIIYLPVVQHCVDYEED